MEWRVTGIFAGRCCAVLFACLFCAAALAGDDDDGVELKILDAGGFAGADVYVPVTMSASTRPSAVAFWIEYDHTKLTFLDAEPGLVVTLAGKDVTWGFPAPGRISFLIFGLNDNRISSGQILLLKFEINSSALPGEEYPVQGLNESSTGPNAEPIDTDIDDGEVEVLNCFKPATPSNFTATDGIFGDRVQLTWSPVFGAQSYVVYRNTANDVSTAQVIATTILTFYSDSSAQGPSNLNSGGCSGGTNVNTSYNTYYYWVRAQNICGQSAPTSAESGYRGKAHLAKATATTLTKMPVLADESTTSLAIRLSANNAIDTQTIVVALNGIDNEIVRTAWSPLNDSGSDGWVWVTLGSPMEPGTTLTLEASARTIGGDAIAPVVAVFSAGHVLNSNALLPSGGPLVVLEYEAEHLPDFVESMGPAYRIAPEANF
ncbi:MAG TPA: cohesin domain-containing protein, partial [Candidatus Hydrogenedentes bacterium]|nr:cohesin domain-containing protein [Candidatus Hydrogenedentota bacterium]